MNLNKMHLSILKFICQILAQSDKVDRSFCKVILSSLLITVSITVLSHALT